MTPHRFLWIVIALLMVPMSCVGKTQTVVNGSFETGDLTGWNTAGTGSTQVLTAAQLAPLMPSDGTYFTLVSNGPGDVGGDGLSDTCILISNPFLVTMTSVLQFDYDFLTAEFTGLNADPSHLDNFVITLSAVGGNDLVLASGDVSLSIFTYVDRGNVVSAPNGTSIIEHTGFTSGISVLAPGSYSLSFRVDDVGDGAFDSALLVDNVRTSPLTTPEPSLHVYLIGALMSVIWWKNKKNKRPLHLRVDSGCLTGVSSLTSR